MSGLVKAIVEAKSVVKTVVEGLIIFTRVYSQNCMHKAALKKCSL
ncbi:MAG: hypothetical protein ACJAUT_000534 [Cellvibrionaceae bacterium]